MRATASTRAERRRAPRIAWRIPLVATWRPRKTVTVREQGWTEVVNDYGGLISLSSHLRPGQQINIQGVKGKPVERARVVGSSGTTKGGRASLGIELENSGLDFWVAMAR